MSWVYFLLLLNIMWCWFLPDSVLLFWSPYAHSFLQDIPSYSLWFCYGETPGSTCHCRRSSSLIRLSKKWKACGHKASWHYAFFHSFYTELRLGLLFLWYRASSAKKKKNLLSTDHSLIFNPNVLLDDVIFQKPWLHMHIFLAVHYISMNEPQLHCKCAICYYRSISS